MKIHPFQAIYPRLEFIASSDSFFGTVKKDYPEFKESGFFHKAAQEGFYIYLIERPERSYLGLVATSDICDFTEGHILKHENTLPQLEQMQLQLFFKRKAAVKPVLLAYPRVKKLEKWMKKFIKNKKPFLEINFDEEQAVHRFWEVSEGSKIEKLQKLFEKHIDKAFIADGHHRTSTAELLYQKMQKEEGEKYRNFLTAFFSFTELQIFDFNRIITGLNNQEPEIIMARLSGLFKIKILKKPALPSRKHELIMLFGHHWYRLRWRKKVLKTHSDEAGLIDAALLNELVLLDILGIEDARTDKRINYVEGPKGLEHFTKSVDEDERAVGFLLYPVDWQDFIAVSESSGILPPKSTWFEPRMKNGVLVHEP